MLAEDPDAMAQQAQSDTSADDPDVVIRRQWNDYRKAKVKLSALTDLQWRRVSGGVNAVSPQPFIHGRVLCTQVDGDIAHSCMHGPPPHEILVCVVKKDNAKDVLARVLELAGPRPVRRSASASLVLACKAHRQGESKP